MMNQRNTLGVIAMRLTVVALDGDGYERSSCGPVLLCHWNREKTCRRSDQLLCTRNKSNSWRKL